MSKSLSDPAIKRCLDAFFAAYVRKHNPPAWADRAVDAYMSRALKKLPRQGYTLPRMLYAKDASLFKKMLADWGEPTVLELIEAFFGAAYHMWGVVNSNQDVGALFAAAPRLLIRREVPDARTASNLDAATKAMGR